MDNVKERESKMISQVFRDDFNKAAKHNDFFKYKIASRIVKREQSRQPELNIKKYAIEFLTPALKASYSEVDARDKAGIDAYIHLLNADNVRVGCIPVQLKSIFTSYRTVAVAECDVEKLANVQYYITIYDNPSGAHEYVVVKARQLRDFIEYNAAAMKVTPGHYKTNQVHSKESFYAMPVYCQSYGYFIHQRFSIFTNNLTLFCEVKYDAMPDKTFKQSINAMHDLI